MTEPSGRRWRRPSPALIVATIALFAALGGGAYAQVAINGKNIRNQSIPGAKLQNQSVGTAQVRDLAIQSRDIQSGAVTVSKLRSGSVTAAKLGRNAVGTAAIAPNAVTRADLVAAARVPNVAVRTSAVAGALSGQLNQAAASCNPGETLIAGGGGIVSAPVLGASLVSSRPELVAGTTKPTRWQVIMANSSPGTIEFQSFAICASP